MARINIEDDVESQKEFRWLLKLLGGDHALALGKLVLFFRAAQDHYAAGTPLTATELKLDGLECMIESRWAVELGEGTGHYQVKNPAKHFDWYRQKKVAAKAGGKARASALRDSGGKFQPATSREPAEIQPETSREPAGDQPATSPPTPTPTPTPTHKDILGDSASPTHPKALQIARLWNLHSGDLPKIRDPERLNSARQRHLKARLKEHPDLEEWEEAIKRMASSSYCQGKKNKPGPYENWIADFDFLLQAKRIDQALEGKWDDRGPSGSDGSDLFKALRGTNA
jgi:hypothetical protein